MRWKQKGPGTPLPVLPASLFAVLGTEPLPVFGCADEGLHHFGTYEVAPKTIQLAKPEVES